MGIITIRGLDDATLHALERRAMTSGRTVEEEARRILESAAQPAVSRSDDFWAQVDQFRAGLGARVFSDSGEIVSEMRRERSNEVGGQ